MTHILLAPIGGLQVCVRQYVETRQPFFHSAQLSSAVSLRIARLNRTTQSAALLFGPEQPKLPPKLKHLAQFNTRCETQHIFYTSQTTYATELL